MDIQTTNTTSKERGEKKMIAKYHDRKTIRERLAYPLYRLPVLPRTLEIFLVLKLIPFIQGEVDHRKHLGSKCPCMWEKKN